MCCPSWATANWHLSTELPLPNLERIPHETVNLMSWAYFLILEPLAPHNFPAMRLEQGSKYCWMANITCSCGWHPITNRECSHTVHPTPTWACRHLAVPKRCQRSLWGSARPARRTNCHLTSQGGLVQHLGMGEPPHITSPALCSD